MFHHLPVKPVSIAARPAALALSIAIAACALEGPNARLPERPAGAEGLEATRGDPRSVTCDEPEPSFPQWTPGPPPLLVVHVPGFPDAVVAEPAADAPHRPLVVALHGLGGRPEPHCDAWRNITEGAAFVLCPRGDDDPQRSTRAERRFTLPGGERLRLHVDAALRALAERFAGRVDVDRPLLAGFSLGAVEAALLAQWDPARFPRVVLLDGGVDQWRDWNIGQFGARGGKRVLFGCGSSWCGPPATAAAGRIERRGLPTRVIYANVGHTNAPALQAAVREQLEWLTDDDARWSAGGVRDPSLLRRPPDSGGDQK